MSHPCQHLPYAAKNIIKQAHLPIPLVQWRHKVCYGELLEAKTHYAFDYLLLKIGHSCFHNERALLNIYQMPQGIYPAIECLIFLLGGFLKWGNVEFFPKI